MVKGVKRILSIVCCMSLTLGSVGFVDASETEEDVQTEIIGEEETDTDIYEEDDDYVVLEVDDKNRERLVKSGDIYITTDYDDEENEQIVYYSEGPLEEDNCITKITIQGIEKNEFNSTYVVTTENSYGTIIQEYDEENNNTRTVDENGKVTVNYYEGEYLISTITPYKGTSEDELNKILYKYDDIGHVIEKKMPIEQNEDGNISYYIEKYGYNDYGDMISYQKTVNKLDEEEIYSKSEYEYDEEGNLLKTIEYDTDGSIISIVQYYYMGACHLLMKQ